MSDKIKRVDIIKTIVLVSILIFGSLGLFLGTTGGDPSGDTGGLSEAGLSVDGLESSRGARQTSPMVTCDNPTNKPSYFVGQQEASIDVVLRSLNEDDNNDHNGDNVLYNISLMGRLPSTADGERDNVMKFDFVTRKFVNYTKPLYDWVTKDIAPSQIGSTNYMLWRGSTSANAWKMVMNQNNNFLDQDNDGTVDPGEYWSVQNTSKLYSGLEFNILGNAEPGYYRMKVKVSYEYQDYQEVNATVLGINPAAATIPDANIETNGILGVFNYYYWYPWDSNSGTYPTNLTTTFNAGDLTYLKSRSYIESAQITPGTIDWEGIRDNGNPGADYPNNYRDYDNDGFTTWMPGDPDANLANIATNYQNFRRQFLATWPNGFVKIIDQIPYNEYQGNGTWAYQGRQSQTTWTSTLTHTEDVWVDFWINSTIVADTDLNEDNNTNDLKLVADDGDYYSGSSFEEFNLSITNADPTIAMENVKATLILPDIDEGGLEWYYPDKNYATIKRIEPSETVWLKFRISVLPTTPPGYYYGGMEITYVKEYQLSQTDPLGQPMVNRVNIIENHWVVEFEIDYTPDLGDATISIPAMSVSARAIEMPDTQIDNSVGKQLFEFSVKNTGNV
jgi:hypothetical protein